MTDMKHAPDTPDVLDAPGALEALYAPDASHTSDTSHAPDVPRTSDASHAPGASGLATQDAPDTLDEAPVTDDRDPARILTAMVDHVLGLAGTWTGWDGRPIPADDRIYTPHKAIRRVADHMVDHLAEMEARLVGEETQPDHWHASATTTESDLAPFTEADLDEARSRLVRLARIWANRLDALTPDQLDRSPGKGWTFRQLAFHLEGSAYYADSVGDLSAAGAPASRQDRTSKP
ncbi:hypothetical protein ACFCZT_18185 [Streptomyces sp. NPDC056230]|uniref:hypothetical protein n=1 Tax=unclassified Streptomyces TaxID=2593676 RepID=UPI0035E198C0